jgi:hypothetical protein
LFYGKRGGKTSFPGLFRKGDEPIHPLPLAKEGGSPSCGRIKKGNRGRIKKRGERPSLENPVLIWDSEKSVLYRIHYYLFFCTG